MTPFCSLYTEYGAGSSEDSGSGSEKWIYSEIACHLKTYSYVDATSALPSQYLLALASTIDTTHCSLSTVELRWQIHDWTDFGGSHSENPIPECVNLEVLVHSKTDRPDSQTAVSCGSEVRRAEPYPSCNSSTKDMRGDFTTAMLVGFLLHVPK